MADVFQFAYNPFVTQRRDVPMFDMGDSSGLVTGIPRPTEQYYELSPELQRQNEALFNNWTSKGNFQLMPYVEGQAPQFRVKTGDKEGTLYTLVPDGQGGYVAAPQGSSQWDTNDQLKQWGPLLPLAAMGGASLISGLGGTGFGGSGLANSGLISSGAMAPSDALLMAGGEPIAGSGFSTASSGAPAFGTPAYGGAGSTLSQAGEAAGSLGGRPNMIGLPGAVAGGTLSAGSLLGDIGNTSIPGVNAPSAPSTGGNQPSPPQQGGGQNPTNPTNPTNPSAPGFQLPTDAMGWLKFLAPVIGGLAMGLEAKGQNGQQLPQDPWTRDWARNQLSNPSVNPAMSGLLNKRYY